MFFFEEVTPTRRTTRSSDEISSLSKNSGKSRFSALHAQ